MKMFATIWAIIVLCAFFAGSYTAYAETEKPSVEMGKKIFNDPNLGTNGKACGSCHNTDENIKKEVSGHPDDKSLKRVINACIKGSIKGKPLPEDSVKMNSLVMYMRSVK